VLIVDDDVLVARSYSALLEDDGLITELEVNPLAVLEKVDAFRPNLILLDLNMPGVSGIEITRVLRQRPDLVSTSIVFLSGETSWDLQQQAMSAGADDFLLKPIEAERLSASVRSRMRRLSQLDRRISRDSLTELMNQGTFKERVQVEVARALRESKPLALALFDLDHFKAVNDTHGHAAGDRVLRALAQLLRDSLRQTDVIARCGGEEFGVLLPGAGEREAQAVMDQLRRAFHDLTHSSAFGEFRVTLSCGIASLPAATNAATLVDWADRALYRAKGNGRNQVALLPESERRASTLQGIEAARARRGGAASSARGTPSSPVERPPK
jgi:diguanylate cyclase (GGDEF)-like protein